MATEQLTVKILDRDYRLSCEENERNRLLAAVAYVDQQMHLIRDQGKVAGADRIAVFAALNIASDLLSQGAPAAASSTAAASAAASASSDTKTVDRPAVADEEILRRMRSINALLDTALVDQERLF
jgi:cell division protein ZapA